MFTWFHHGHFLIFVYTCTCKKVLSFGSAAGPCKLWVMVLCWCQIISQLHPELPSFPLTHCRWWWNLCPFIFSYIISPTLFFLLLPSYSFYLSILLSFLTTSLPYPLSLWNQLFDTFLPYYISFIPLSPISFPLFFWVFILSFLHNLANGKVVYIFLSLTGIIIHRCFTWPFVIKFLSRSIVFRHQIFVGTS
jgi:hypothetical protein